MFALPIFYLLTLVFSVSGEKETLLAQHNAELQKWKYETARLKEELIQFSLKHHRELKKVGAAA
jgi:hypothetical protein